MYILHSKWHDLVRDIAQSTVVFWKTVQLYLSVESIATCILVTT